MAQDAGYRTTNTIPNNDDIRQLAVRAAAKPVSTNPYKRRIVQHTERPRGHRTLSANITLFTDYVVTQWIEIEIAF